MGWDTYNQQELKMSAIRCFLILFAGLFLFSILFYFISKSIVISEFIVLAGFFSGLYSSIIVYERDWLDEKVGLFSEIGGFSYQGQVILLFTLSIGLSIAFFGIALVQGGLYSAIAFSVAVYFPSLFMILRLNVYKDENSRWMLVEDEFGNKCYNLVFGYNPIFYYLLGVTQCRGPMGLSIRWILDSIFLNVRPFEYSVFCFIISLAVACFILSPDVVNKIVPFELKTVGGFKKFLIIAFMLIISNIAMVIDY